MRTIARYLTVFAVTLLVCSLVFGCAKNQSADDAIPVESGSQGIGSAEADDVEPVLDPEPVGPAMIEDLDEIPENIREGAKQKEDSLKMLLLSSRGEEMSTEDMEIGQRIKKYAVTEDGVEEFDVAWPIYIDGELVALLTEDEMLGSVIYDWDVNTPPIINESGLDTLAIVFDYDRMYLSDGTQLIETEMITGPVETRVPVTEENEAEIVAACELGHLGAIIGRVND